MVAVESPTHRRPVGAQTPACVQLSLGTQLSSIDIHSLPFGVMTDTHLRPHSPSFFRLAHSLPRVNSNSQIQLVFLLLLPFINNSGVKNLVSES